MNYYKQVHIKTKNLTKKYRLYKACEVFSHYLTVKLPFIWIAHYLSVIILKTGRKTIPETYEK